MWFLLLMSCVLKDGLFEEEEAAASYDTSVAPTVLVTLHKEWFYEVSTEDATLTPLAPTAGNRPSVSYRSSDGLLVATKEGLLYHVNHCTGIEIAVAELTVGTIPGISFGPNGVLYGINQESDELITIDPLSGVIDTVAETELDIGNTGMAYDPLDKVMYMVDSKRWSLMTVDVETGELLDDQYLSLELEYGGLAFDSQERVLYLSTGDELFVLDPADPTPQFVGDLGDDKFNDLTFLPPCL